MSDQTNTTAPSLPILPVSGEATYNRLMQDINPELTFPAITQIESKYAGESGEAKAMRARRYDADFKEYAKRSRAHDDSARASLRTYARGMLQYLEHVWQGKEQSDLDRIALHISQL